MILTIARQAEKHMGTIRGFARKSGVGAMTREEAVQLALAALGGP